MCDQIKVITRRSKGHHVVQAKVPCDECSITVKMAKTPVMSQSTGKKNNLFVFCVRSGINWV